MYFDVLLARNYQLASDWMARYGGLMFTIFVRYAVGRTANSVGHAAFSA